ncbi:MAG: type II 3-dehydroquinate dehydratase [Alicyclobacillus herbarius]|uniref:type II 3-dehydroquinate dehydratase n=1 Tax=Alicyclobacillus herbarius TaxID=122960 RepID=UPI002353FD7A|nr:type II 3-dehydroquinate dehydratase [Alicyclobacillus herbarius]MCL6631640.1 type II 3-dehydroquinate dehydratase [Alicyclobacillus herbarius]
MAGLILLLHGPNLNRLGQRQPHIYGKETLADVVARVRKVCEPHGVEVKDFQSNHEGAIIDFVQTHGPQAQGIILNPGALAHYGYALRDCLEDIGRPVVEIHISNVHRREPFRHQLVLAPVAIGQIVGLGPIGYEYAAHYLLQLMTSE